MHVVFRVEGSASIGLGHIMRCLGLAQGLTRNGHTTSFVMSKESAQFCQSRQDWIGEITILPNLKEAEEVPWIHAHCQHNRASWLILDGYQFSENYRLELRTEHYKLAMFDDMNDSGSLHTELVINGSNAAANIDYQQTAPNALLATGERFSVLRQEFIEIENLSWDARTSLLVMFGGSDPYNKTIEVVDALTKCNATAPIVLITGAAYSRLTELKTVIEKSGLNIRHIHDCQSMVAELTQSRLTISAAGGSQFELRACATPAILVVVADNQKPATQQAVKQAWCRSVNAQTKSVLHIVQMALQLWRQSDLLCAMHQSALQLPINDGAQHIVELMDPNAVRGM
jgi:UDP-2,4-diacetamido-2,4,6-trideoxy-beta-L-altropyranose hydrolase